MSHAILADSARVVSPTIVAERATRGPSQRTAEETTESGVTPDIEPTGSAVDTLPVTYHEIAAAAKVVGHASVACVTKVVTDTTFSIDDQFAPTTLDTVPKVSANTLVINQTNLPGDIDQPVDVATTQVVKNANLAESANLVFNTKRDTLLEGDLAFAKVLAGSQATTKGHVIMFRRSARQPLGRLLWDPGGRPGFSVLLRTRC